MLALFAAVVSAFGLPVIAHAGFINDFLTVLGQGSPADSTFSKLVNLIERLAILGVQIVLFVAFIFLILSGYQYVTSLGNKQQAEAAKNSLLYITIGVLVILGAYLVVTTIGDFFIKPGFTKYLIK